MSNAQRSKATRRRQNKRCRELTQLREINPAEAVRRENQMLGGWAKMAKRHIEAFAEDMSLRQIPDNDEGLRRLQDIIDRARHYGLHTELEPMIAQMIDRYLRHPLAGNIRRHRQG